MTMIEIALPADGEQILALARRIALFQPGVHVIVSERTSCPQAN